MSDRRSHLRPLTPDLRPLFSNGRPNPAAPLAKRKQLRLVTGRRGSLLISSNASTGVAGHVSNSLFIFKFLFRLVPPYSHFDPFGTEFYVSRGGSTIQDISDFGLRIADFQLNCAWASNPSPQSAIR